MLEIVCLHCSRSVSKLETDIYAQLFMQSLKYAIVRYVVPTLLYVSIRIGVFIGEGDILICIMLSTCVTFGHELLMPVMIFNFHTLCDVNAH